MKNALVFTAIVLATGLAACGKSEPPKSDTRVESASEALRADNKAIAERLAVQMAEADKSGQTERAADERKQQVESLYDIARRWDNAVEGASKTARVKLEESMKAMQAIKAEAEAAAVNECTGKARAFLLESMNASLQAFEQFRKETTNDPSESTKQKNKQAANLLAESSAALAGCK